MIKFAFDRLKNYKSAVLVIAVCSVMISVTDLMIPFLTAKFIDEILVVRNVAEFYNFILILFAIMTAAILSHYVCSILSKKILLSTTNSLVEEILQHVQSLKGEFILSRDMVYLAKRVDKDTTDFFTFVVDSMIEVCFNFFILIIASVLLMSIGGKWLLIFFIVLTVHVSAYKILSKTLFNRSVAVRESGSKYFTSLTDNFICTYSIKLHCLHEKYLSEFKDMFGKYFAAAISEARIKFWFTNTDLNSSDIFRILVFLLGGLDVINGEMTIGNLVALIGYYALAMQSVAYFMSFGQGWQNALAAHQRLMEIKNIPTDKEGELKPSGITSVEVSGLSCSIEGRDVLKNFSHRFVRGKIYCIVGKNGAGKTTLLNFLCGIFKPNEGTIKYDGITIKAIDMLFVRKNFISVVEQKEFIRNDDLSGGERRKKNISKALAKNPDLLIMDEPDNNLDEAGIKNLIETLCRVKSSRITILISHDERIVSIADEIVEL